MKRFASVLLFLLLSGSAWADGLRFDIVEAQGEGDNQSAQPYLQGLYNYLQTQIAADVSGTYHNDETNALKAFEAKTVDLAIVDPVFLSKHGKKLKLAPLLQTIPIYSSGPFQRSYVLAHKDVKMGELLQSKKPVEMYSSKDYTLDFLKKKVFRDDDPVLQMQWTPRKSTDFLTTLNELGESKKQGFALLTAHEFHVIQKLKKQNSALNQLKIVYTSKDQPTSSLVASQKIDRGLRDKLIQALLEMHLSLEGGVILKRLRLKSFTLPESS